jgi:hypothetical protein
VESIKRYYDGSRRSEFMRKILGKIFIKFISPSLREIDRPKDIVFPAPDCGWNHGEQKSEVERKAEWVTAYEPSFTIGTIPERYRK